MPDIRALQEKIQGYDVNAEFDPRFIANSFIVRPQFQKTDVGITIDDGANMLIFLEVLGYTRWNEIAALPEILNLDTTNMCKCKKYMLKELRIIL